MQTTLFQVKFNDGRLFKVFCANKRQIDRFRRTTSIVKDYEATAEIKVLENGIHNVTEWEHFTKSLTK